MRNIVLISVDALNADAVRGAVEADAADLPHLGRLVRESARVTPAYATSSWTLPSHASLLTGLYPTRHGATHLLRRVPEALETLPERLRHAGFDTLGATGGGYLDASFGFAQGFREYVAGDPVSERGFESMERALDLLRRRRRDAPFFLFVHTYGVHDYFRGAAGPREMRRLPCLTGKEECPEGVWDRLQERYRERVVLLDRELGRLIGLLEDEGELETTAVILVSDHGEGLDPEAGRLHHGGRLQADVTRIPMLFRLPGGGGRTVEAPASLVDVLPTALDLVGLPPMPGLDGESLAPALEGGTVSGDRTLYAMGRAFRWEDGTRSALPEAPDRPLSIAVIRPDRYYIRTPEGEELYLADDPGQERNVVEGDPLAGELRALADAAAGEAPGSQREPLDPELEERLRSLGYLH